MSQNPALILKRLIVVTLGPGAATERVLSSLEAMRSVSGTVSFTVLPPPRPAGLWGRVPCSSRFRLVSFALLLLGVRTMASAGSIQASTWQPVLLWVCCHPAASLSLLGDRVLAQELGPGTTARKRPRVQMAVDGTQLRRSLLAEHWLLLSGPV
ncbi:hypothetical protein GHT09_008778 [Marmota monax]|uniref:Uncharacterized protein n=1 Tax=Marmota monax TaxID=9995 RepID=A0A834QI96_MARMO|nr:hypothetical protein GHT09_008778 [Marmota monax]